MQRLEPYEEKILYKDSASASASSKVVKTSQVKSSSSSSQRVETSQVKSSQTVETSQGKSSQILETTHHQTTEVITAKVSGSEDTYSKILRAKGTFTITKSEVSIAIIPTASLTKITNLLGSNPNDLIEMISFNILTIEEIVEQQAFVKTNVKQTHIFQRSYAEMKLNYLIATQKANKLIRNTLVLDFLDLLDLEVIKGKREIEEEKVVNQVILDSQSPNRKKNRATELSEKTQKGKTEIEIETESIEESEMRKAKKKKTAAAADEEKTTTADPTVTSSKDPIRKERSHEEKTSKIETTTVADETKKKTFPKKKTIPTKRVPETVEKQKEEIEEKVEEKKEQVEEIKKEKKKKTIPKKKSPDEEIKEKEPEIQKEAPPEKKKVIKTKKIVRKKKETENEQTYKPSKAFISGGGGSGMYYEGGQSTTIHHCLSEKCVVCKGLPVRPHVCSVCNRQYCTMCTYELPNSSKCTDCQGRLIIMNQSNGSTAFEATITKFSPQKAEEAIYQKNNVKDFFETHKDRYKTSQWEEEEDNALNQNQQLLRSSNNKSKINRQSIKRHEAIITDQIVHEGIDWSKYYHIKEYAFGLNVEKKLNLNHNDSIWSLCYIPEVSTGLDGILTGHSSGNIYLWSIDKQIKTKSFSEHTAKVYDIKLLPHCGIGPKVFFVTISEDRFAKVWDLTCMNSLLSLSNLYPIYCLDILSSTSFIIGDKNQQMTYYQISPQSPSGFEKRSVVTTKTEHSSFIWRILHLKKVKTPNCLISASESTLFLHELSNDNKVITAAKEFINGHQGLIHSITELTKGKFATSAVDHTIRIWHYQHEQCLQVMDRFYDSTIYSMIYLNEHNDSSQKLSHVFIVGGYDRKMKIVGGDYDGQKAFEYSNYDRPESLYKMAFLTNNSKFKVASINFGCSSNLYIWGLNSLD